MFVFALAFLFFGSCFTTRSATVDVKQGELKVESRELKPSLSNQTTCSPTNFTNTTISTIYGGNWGVRLLIASKLTIGSSPLTNVAFYISGNTNGQSTVDILVYNSTSDSNANPAFLIAKVPNVDLNSFTSNAFSCVSLQQFPNLKQLSTGVYWIGFYNSASGAKVVGRQNLASGGKPYFYSYVTGSPFLGAAFPSNPNTENYVLTMGTQLSVGSCSSQPCGTCGFNSNCVWCLSTAACINTAQIPTCKTWTRNPNFCSVCSQYSSCSSCVNQPQCAWCLTNGKPNVCLEEVKDGNCTTAVREPQFCSV